MSSSDSAVPASPPFAPPAAPGARRSLKTRLILGSLAVFLVSLWSLSFLASWILRADMERLLGEQQYSTVSMVADRVDREFSNRIELLESVARQVEMTVRFDQGRTQSALDSWTGLAQRFNGGSFVIGRDGMAIAASPLSSGRLGVDYSDRQYFKEVMQNGRPVISAPVMGRISNTPVVVVAVPLHNGEGKAIGVLAGVINMTEPTFLDQATQNRYGRTGGYLLVVPGERMIATATDKRRVMEILPLGKDALLDSFMSGFEEFGIATDMSGDEILTAAKGMPVAGWYVSGYLPTAEAFDPIRKMERYMLATTATLTLFAGLFFWWMLTRQLTPLVEASGALAQMSQCLDTSQPLPVRRDDEIGQLIGGFNHLLGMLRQRELLLQQILDTSNVGIFVVDSAWRLMRVNRHMCDMFQYSQEALLGADYLRLVPDDEHEETSQRQAALAEDGVAIDIDRLYRRADGSHFWGHLTARSFLDAHGRDAGSDVFGRRGQIGIVGVVSDITARKEAEDGNKLAASVFSHAREGIVITSPNGTIVDVNAAFTRITGYEREEVVGQNPRIMKSHHHEAEFYATMWRDLLDNGCWNGEIWNRRKNGELFPELLTISAVQDERGAVKHYVALFTDITPMKEHEEKLRHMAHYDLLTTLPNRVLLGDRLQHAMALAHRRDRLLMVACLDLDGFKLVNDTHGHSVGDQLLIALANRMRLALRDSDTLARLGGDEFVAVLSDLDDVAAALPMIGRLLSAAAQPARIGEAVLQVSASLGATFYPQSEVVDADQLLRQADQAMYQAKLTGRNSYQIFDADQDRSLRGRNENLESIRHALIERQFVLYYQPKVNMRLGQVVGAEALIRWQHPSRGLLGPANFLPIIEDHPLAIEIGEWVLAEALAQVARWASAGLDIPVSVNVSAHQLQQADFSERLRTILGRYPEVAPNKLTLELLENSALEDLAGVSRLIADCRQLGISFALDDFGTGYSSLTYLKRLDVEQLKIDQSFVRDMLDDADDLTILDGVISLAAAFNRDIIAEGVETAAHGEMLLLLGCEQAQGYGIARPMPASELMHWVANWQPDPGWQALRPLVRAELPVLFMSAGHRTWVLGVLDYLAGHEAFPDKLDANECRLGQWLAGAGHMRYGRSQMFDDIGRLHEEVHALAASLCAQERSIRISASPAMESACRADIVAGGERLLAMSNTLRSEFKKLLTGSMYDV